MISVKLNLQLVSKQCACWIFQKRKETELFFIDDFVECEAEKVCFVKDANGT